MTTSGASPDTGSFDDALAALLRDETAPGWLQDFLAATTVEDALQAWFAGIPFDVSDEPDDLRPVDQFRGALHCYITRIDEVLNAYVDAIRADPQFQTVESAWRGVAWLIDAAQGDPRIRVRVLNASLSDLNRDSETAIDFDQSQLFRKVYEQEFGHPGGEPFGLLLVDAKLSHRIIPGESTPGRLLSHLCGTAAAAFCPTVVSASPELFGVDDWAALMRCSDLPRVYQSLEYISWRSLRKSPDTRFLALSLPDVLLRGPDTQSEAVGTGFRCHARGPRGASRTLWGNSVYAVGAAVIGSFVETGWFDAMYLGMPHQTREVTPPAWRPLSTDFGALAHPAVRTCLPEVLSQQLTDAGLTVVSHCRLRGRIGLVEARPLHDDSDGPRAPVTERLDLMLAASRMAHCLKKVGRNLVGDFFETAGLQARLNTWVQAYASSSAAPTEAVRTHHPWAQASVNVTDIPGRPGASNCTMRLTPYEADEEIRLSVSLN